ncbi:MAG: CHASE domain-containing protein [Gallionella sp.]|nr:CHASE domain-containing protein [Gallionella sp.]
MSDRSLFAKRYLKAWLVLLACLSASVYVSYLAKSNAESDAQHQIAMESDDIQHKIAARLEAHKQVLLGGAALFDASQSVERDEWHAYAKRLQIDRHFNGIQGLGFSLLIPQDQLDRHTAEIRKQGFPDYAVRPAGKRNVYSSIVYLEPFEGRNLRAFGYDMYSEPVRRAAMEQARDEGMVALSGKVILVQETSKDVQAGTLMYVPVYRKAMSVETIEQRRAALYGWVYSPFRMDDLLEGVLKNGDNPMASHLHLEVYDGHHASADSLLYNSEAGRGTAPDISAPFNLERHISLYGREWTLRFTHAAGSVDYLDYSEAWIVLIGGLGSSLLLFLLMLSYLDTRRNAELIAAELTTELRNSSSELALHNHILRQVSMGMSLHAVLDELVRQVEAMHPDMLCSIFLLDEEGKHLRRGAAPSLPESYRQAIEGLEVSEDAGLYGTAAYRGERVIVADVNQHQDWELLRGLARQTGVRSCWSQPIKDSAEHTLGTFTVYHKKPAQPSNTEIVLMERYAKLAALVIERVRIQDDLRLKDLALNVAANAVVITDNDARIQWVNQAFSKLTGYSVSEAIGHRPKELVRSGKQSQSYYEQLWQTILSGKPWRGELINRHKDGTLYDEEMTITPVVDEQGVIAHFVAVKQDISERKANEAKIRRISNIYAALSQCNEVIVRCTDEEQLFPQICRIAVQFGGMKMAWIGLVDEAGKRVNPVASYGDDMEYLKDIHISTDAGEPYGRGPTGTAIRENRSFWCQDFQRDPATAMWHERGIRSGWGASAALPLLRNGVVIGALTLYAGEIYAFDEAIRKLLIEMCADISFALDNFDLEAKRKQTEEQIKQYVAQIEMSFMQTVEVATILSEMRDPYTAGHERRVSEIAAAIGAELGFDQRQQDGLKVAGHLHDVGKITIPTEILAKPGRLSEIEFLMIKGHPQAGYDVLKDVKFPWPVAEIALQHHERMDGSGYPRGLKGDEILLDARIMAVADVVESMSSHRPYRPALGIQAALAEIERGSGSIYDPSVASACLRLFREKDYSLPV